MTEGVVATVIWKINPDLAESCKDTLHGMFPVTRQRKCFRNIRLLGSAHDPHELVMIQEWDSVQDHQNYIEVRAGTGDTEKLVALIIAPMQLNYWTNSPVASAQA